jgi:hypothetical protein
MVGAGLFGAGKVAFGQESGGSITQGDIAILRWGRKVCAWRADFVIEDYAAVKRRFSMNKNPGISERVRASKKRRIVSTETIR